MPNGWTEPYEACIGLPGDGGQRTSQLASSEQAQFQALAKTPLEFVHYDVVRRQDHAEWRQCTAKQDCAVASGPCGATDVVAKSAKKAYASWTATRQEQINCDQFDEARPVLACEEGKCIDTNARPASCWSACAADADCVIDLVCDGSTPINKRMLADEGYQRWRWFRVVDAWDRCNEEQSPPIGKCVGGRCALR